MALITVFLQRRTGEPDDILRVFFHRNEGCYEVKYRDGDVNEVSSVRMGITDVWHYLAHLLYMLGVDTCPFRFIQLSCAGFPSVVYPIVDLDWGGLTCSHVLSVFYFALNDWVIQDVGGIPSVRSSGTTTARDEDNDSVGTPPPPPPPLRRASP